MRTSLGIAFLILLLFSVVPVSIVVGDSFLAEGGGLTLDNYRGAFSEARDYRIGLLGESVLLALLATAFATLLGVPYAFFCTRVGTPLRRFFAGLYVLPLVLPPLLTTMGWTEFLRNLAGDAGTGPTRALGGLRGAAFIFGLVYFPFVVLFARKAFLEIGAGLEEAARISVGPFRAFGRVTLRLSVPSLLAGALFVFVFTLADFSVVDYLTFVTPPEDTVSAFSFESFQAWSTNYDQLGRREAAALGMPLAALSILALVLIFWLIRRGRHVSMVSGHRMPANIEESSPPLVRHLLRGGGFVFLTAVLVVSVGIPVFQLIRDTGGQNGDFVGNMRETLLGEAAGLKSIGNGLLYAAIAAFVAVLVALVLSHHMVRRGPKRESLILILALLPLTCGPILFAAGLIRLWNRRWLEIGGENGVNPVYDTLLIIVFMLVGKYLVFALAAVSSSMRRIDPGYEEVAAVSGVGWGRRMIEVLAPLANRGITGGFVLVFIFCMRELDTIVLLTTADRTTAIWKIYTMVHTGADVGVAALSTAMVVVIALPFLLYVLLTARKVEVL